MRFFWQQRRAKARDTQQGVTDVVEKAVTGATDISALVPTRSAASFMGYIRESFAGAWQRGFTVNNRHQLMAFSAVYRCVTSISHDIAKLRIRLVENIDGIWREVESISPYWPVLHKPNKYQNRIQFFMAWIASKLMYGNTYVLKVRDKRGIVVELHVLDPRRVTPLVASNGDVYYALRGDDLARVKDTDTAVPALEIIHDRCDTLFHPLVGISPLYACAIAATQGNKIQENSGVFFENMSRPSGVLTSPLTIRQAQADDYKKRWEENFSGGNMGRVAVLGDQLKYESLSVTAVDSDLMKQLDWTVQDVARAFGVPLYKIGIVVPGASNDVEGRQQQYYDDCLQILVESIELCLDEGLGLDRVEGRVYGTEFDLMGLMRMDSSALAEYLKSIVGAGVMAPNEARALIGLGPVKGGDKPYLQQQNFSLEALANRDASPDPFKTADKAPAAAAPAAAATAKDDQSAKALDAVRDMVANLVAAVEVEKTERLNTHKMVEDMYHKAAMEELVANKEAAELNFLGELTDVLVGMVDAEAKVS